MNQQQLIELQQRNKVTGDRGEDYVLSLERKRLAGHPLLYEVKIAGRYDVGLGYDIASFESLTSQKIDRYIEVKTYNGNPHFFLSQSEHAAAEKHTFRYYLYLVDEARLNDPIYEPIIIRNPIQALNNDCWQQRLQQAEYTFIDNSISFPDDFNDSTVLVGCYNNNTHINWILSHNCYNVRSSEGSSRFGAVSNDAIASSVRYLLLYNVQSPRSYSFYKIDKAMLVSRNQMISYGYRNPHAQHYILYHIVEKIQLPPLDIMQIIRITNDKVQRTSGCPIYMQGTVVRRFFDKQDFCPGISAPKRHYTNEGKPWTNVQDTKLIDWIREGRDTAFIALKLYRTSKEVEERRLFLNI